MSTLTKERGEGAVSKGRYKPLCVQGPVLPHLQNMGFGYLQKRGELVSSVLQMGQAFGLNEEVAHDAILLMEPHDVYADTGDLASQCDQC